jgi:hypothetical protein
MSWRVCVCGGGERQTFGAHGSHHLVAACVLAGTGNIQPFVWFRSIPKASGFSFTTVYTKQRRGLKRRVLLFGRNGLNYIPESCYTKRLRSSKMFPPQLCFLIRKTPSKEYKLSRNYAFTSFVTCIMSISLWIKVSSKSFCIYYKAGKFIT